MARPAGAAGPGWILTPPRPAASKRTENKKKEHERRNQEAGPPGPGQARQGLQLVPLIPWARPGNPRNPLIPRARLGNQWAHLHSKPPSPRRRVALFKEDIDIVRKGK